jgi:hypothetical protein
MGLLRDEMADGVRSQKGKSGEEQITEIHFRQSKQQFPWK